MPVSESFRSRIAGLLEFLYGKRAEETLGRIDQLADRYASLRRPESNSLWDERTAVLITYGNQVSSTGHTALQTQSRFLIENGLQELLSAVHLLPFFPYSSDDGFSVIDYRRVDPAVGDWEDVDRLGRSFGMAFDFVVNHCSHQHDWFGRFLQGESPYIHYFLVVDPSEDLSLVTRPRRSPLLTPFETARGTQHVWTTFSADQIDLNFRSPDVLLEFLDILLQYVQHGATIIRLDAIGFLWKRIGTTCMHLPETHAVVKLMRALLDDVAPGTVVLTETNVPHQENISYFGEGDEAHCVYQFSLAPLLLDACLTGDATPLTTWMAELEFPGDRRTYLNFTASHDGIGVRPLEGLVSQDRLDALVEGVRQRGGLVSLRKNTDGSESPYELNISYVSALDSSEGLATGDHARRFLATQGFMLALRGVPGIYFHSLVGTCNDHDGVCRTGQNRSINRRKFEVNELRAILSNPDSLQRKVFDGYRHLLAVRIAQPAFHPDAPQRVLETGSRSLVAFLRTSLSGQQRILVLMNVCDIPIRVDLRDFQDADPTRDLLRDCPISSAPYEIAPHDIAWLG